MTKLYMTEKNVGRRLIDGYEMLDDSDHYQPNYSLDDAFAVEDEEELGKWGYSVIESDEE